MKINQLLDKTIYRFCMALLSPGKQNIAGQELYKLWCFSFWLSISIHKNKTIRTLIPCAASGGFVIYPNKPNTNMMQQVYKK